MKKKLFSFVALSIMSVCSWGQGLFSASEVKSVMKRVADWQIANPAKGAEHDDLSWTHATLYMGMIDWAELTEKEDGDNSYYNWLRSIGKRNAWQVGRYMYHADFIAVGQVFIDMYHKYGDRNMLLPTMARTEFVINHPSASTLKLDYRNMVTLERWSWCDALFMAPPVYAKMYMLTNDRKYVDFMNQEYKATYNYLFDKEKQLFYRDHRYFGKKEANGERVFWGRGNGWVLGGLCEILQALPRNNMHREFYQDLFVRLSNLMASLQGEDGYWHASLLDPKSYPSPETSATGFIVYALAYGVNEGLLDKEQMIPVIKKGWEALVKAVEKDGKLGYVQPIGADPKKVTREMTEVYGVGAFLLAGNQMYKLVSTHLSK